MIFDNSVNVNTSIMNKKMITTKGFDNFLLCSWITIVLMAFGAALDHFLHPNVLLLKCITWSAVFLYHSVSLYRLYVCYGMPLVMLLSAPPMAVAYKWYDPTNHWLDVSLGVFVAYACLVPAWGILYWCPMRITRKMKNKY